VYEIPEDKVLHFSIVAALWLVHYVSLFVIGGIFPPYF